MTSCPDIDSNFLQIEKALAGMQFDQPTLIVMPECFAFFGGSDRDMLANAEPLANGNFTSKTKIQFSCTPQDTKVTIQTWTIMFVTHFKHVI